MSVRRVITHVVESQPLFVTISHQPEWFKKQYVDGGVIWQHFPIRKQIDASLIESLHEAHKVIVDTAGCSFDERTALITALTPHQAKVKLLVPIYSLWQLRVAGEIPGWQVVQDWQRALCARWSSLLPDANIIFLRDVLDWEERPLFGSLLTQHISQQVIFAIEGKFAVGTKSHLVRALFEESSTPPRGSVIIQTSEYVLSTLLERAVPLYESMYRARIDQQLVQTTNLELTPYPCRVKEAPASLSESADQIGTILPPPSQHKQWSQQCAEALVAIEADPWFVSSKSQAVAPAELQTTTHNLHPQNPSSEIADSTKSHTSADTNIDTSANHLGADGNQSSGSLTDESNSPDSPSLSYEAVIPSSDDSILVSEAEKEQQLKEDVRRLFASQGIKRHTAVVERKSIQRKVVQKRSRKRTLAFYLGVLFISAGLFFAGLLGTTQVTQQLARREFTVVANNLTTTNQTTANAVQWGKLPLLLSLLRPQQATLNAVFSLPMLDTSSQMLEAEKTVRKALELRDSRTEKMATLYSILIGQSTGDVAEATASLSQDAVTAQELATTLASTTTQLPEPLSSALASAAAELLPSTTDRKQDLLTKSLLPQLAGLTGSSGLRRYVVVLQNSQELRPTGGFIEAIGVLTFNGGSLISQDIYSSYQLDARLPGEIKPPLDLTSTLGETQWWLHDANWFADGSAAGGQVLWFVEKTLQQAPDGVIFINTAGLPKLLRSLGPMEMQVFNEVLTEKNIAERLEFHNELPNQISPDKPEYRQELLRQILNKLTTLSPEQVPTLFSTIHTLLDEKQMVLSLKTVDDQKVFRQLGWTGDLTFPTCPAAYVANGCVVDGLALVESNIGANRANAYIARQQEHTAVLSRSGVRHERKIQYTNAATTKAWPKGDYRTYMRAYMPGKPTNLVVTFDGTTLPSNEVAVRETEFGTEVAFVVTVPIASTKSLRIQYDENQALTPTSTYVFYENRQAGLTEPIPTLNIVYPQDWRVSSLAPSAINLGSQLQFPPSQTAYLMRVVQFTPAQ